MIIVLIFIQLFFAAVYFLTGFMMLLEAKNNDKLSGLFNYIKYPKIKGSLVILFWPVAMFAIFYRRILNV